LGVLFPQPIMTTEVRPVPLQAIGGPELRVSVGRANGLR
jgi:hypothetical protein